MLGAVSDSGDGAEKKMDKNLCPRGSYVLVHPENNLLLSEISMPSSDRLYLAIPEE